MGVKVEVAPATGFTGNPRDSVFLNVDTYTSTEAGSPLTGVDTSGEVGTITFTAPWRHNIYLLNNRDIRVSDSRRGFTEGTITSVGRSDENGNVPITATSRMSKLNIFNVQAQPYIGTLEGAFRYYASLANVSTGINIDPLIRNRQVVFPGWYGELYYNMKMLAASQDVDLNLVSGVILMRPIRAREVVRDHQVTSSIQMENTGTAQSVEVFYYNNRPINNEMVYPIGGWNPEVEVISANSGEYVEQTLELSSSVSSIQQPVFQTYVSPTHSSSSVFTVVADDGLPITLAAWNAGGGSLVVDIDPDTSHLTVKFRAPSGLFNSRTGDPIGVYSLALGSDLTGNRYSTLRILGTGVGFDKKSVLVSTGLTPQQTGQEVGATIDIPYISSINTAYLVGVRAARIFSGYSVTNSGSVTAVNRFDDPGSAMYSTYQTVQDAFQGVTNQGVISNSVIAGMTNQEQVDYFQELAKVEFADQVIGNVGGSRYWDRESGNFFRIRSGSVTPDLIGIEGDLDTTHQDVHNVFSTKTYAELQNAFQNLTYSEVEMRGATVV